MNSPSFLSALTYLVKRMLIYVTNTNYGSDMQATCNNLVIV